MPLFRKTSPAPARLVTFDGVAGRQSLASLAASFLQHAGTGNIEPVGNVAQSIFQATPGDRSRQVGSDFLVAPWKWMAAVATRAEQDQDYLLAGQIRLVTEIWNRQIINDDPRYQMGRLRKTPFELEQQIYKVALRSLVKPCRRQQRGAATDAAASRAVCAGMDNGTAEDAKTGDEPRAIGAQHVIATRGAERST